MASQCYLGVDLGAESGRVMAGLWDGKRVRLEAIHRFPNGPVEIAGSLHWDVLRLWSEIQNGLSLASKSHRRTVKSVGVDTWGVDFVLLSRHDQLLGQPYHYRDSRTKGMMKRAFVRVPRKEIFASSGVQFMEINTLYQLLAVRKYHPELLEAADCLLMMPDFFHWCLSGIRAAEFTDATTTQFLHPVQRRWSTVLLKKLGLPNSILPKLIEPGTRLGSLRKSVAERAGLASKASVIAPASHDTASAVAAVPTEGTGQANWAYISSGTWSLMGVEVPTAKLSPDVLKHNFTNEGGVDGTYRLLKNITGLWIVQQCKRAFEALGKKLNYEELVLLSREAKPLRSLINPDDPAFHNPDDMPTAIRQYCLSTGQPRPDSEGALIRCALESLALRYQSVLACLEAIVGKQIETIHIVGGGSKNHLLNQFAADACNRQVIAGPVEATVLGNVLMQARACGEIGSLIELRSVVRNSVEIQVFEPTASRMAAWEEARGRFAALIAGGP